jgi:transcription antitermination protein NusB
MGATRAREGEQIDRQMNPDERGVRPRGRELALAVLCHLESYAPAERAEARGLVWDSPPFGDAEGEDAFAVLAADSAARRFGEALVDHVLGHWSEIDEAIEQTSRRWRLARMDRVDRNVIRLAAAELLATPDTPRGVVLAEAVRLAGRYGSERSVRFVNGLVEALATRLRPSGAS